MWRVSSTYESNSFNFEEVLKRAWYENKRWLLSIISEDFHMICCSFDWNSIWKLFRTKHLMMYWWESNFWTHILISNASHIPQNIILQWNFNFTFYNECFWFTTHQQSNGIPFGFHLKALYAFIAFYELQSYLLAYP